MTETPTPVLIAPPISLQAFFFKTPLYEKITIPVPYIKNYLMRGLTFDGYCPFCKRASTFSRSPKATRTGYADKYYLELVEYDTNLFHCARNQNEHVIRFECLLDKGTLQKVGQYPSFADIAIDESKDYSKLLDKEDISEFHKAIGLAAHGVGIGSYVYLRRIFERLIAKRFQEYKAIEGWTDEKFFKLRMAEKIAHLKNHLPEFLVKNAKMYSILSLGVHELNEKDCLTFFPVLRQSTVWILEQDKKKQEELAQQRELEKAIAGFTPKSIPAGDA